MASSSKQSDGRGLSENSSDVEVVADRPADGNGASTGGEERVVAGDEGGSPAEVGPENSNPAPDTKPTGAAVQTDENGQGDGGDNGPDHDAGQRVGEMLAGRYKLTEFIERGAMGDVYRAEHALMKKTVAVKILNADISGQGKIVERFRREAQAAANIDHANVCVATDFGETDEGDFFLVMEFLEGETLSSIIEREGRLGDDRAMHVAYQIVGALARAHEVGVIHRDLKPDNIMLIERGDDADFVKILDFGIARVRMEDETPELTKTGAVFGTPSYMSPEQAAGDPIDHRADLYALGNVLFEMVTGRRVFQADRGAQVMAMHVSKDPPVPSDVIDGSVHPGFEQLILQLLDKDPDNRPQSAEELQKRLLEIGPADIGRRVVPDREESDDQHDELAPDSAPVELETVEDDDASQVVVRALDSASTWLKRKGAGTRWTVLGMVGLLAVLTIGFVIAGPGLGGGVAVNRDTGDESQPVWLAEQRYRFTQRPAVKEAIEAMNRGAFGQALNQLQSVRERQETENPHLLYLIGRAHAGREDWMVSLAHFEKALDQEPHYIRDRQLLEDLIGALGSKDDDIAERAQKLLAPRLDYDLVLARIGRAAWHGGSSRLRKRAFDLLKAKQQMSELPKWVQHSIDLRHSYGCEEHRVNIKRLVKLGDTRGIEVLRIYADLPKHGCGEDDSEDCFGCIRSDIAEAMSELKKGKQKKASAEGKQAEAKKAGSKKN